MNDKQLWQNTLTKLKAKCKQDDIPFSLTIGDVINILNDTCVYTGLPLFRRAGTGSGWQPNTPTLAMVDPSKGYIPGNIVVISNLAATIVSTLNPDQLSNLVKAISPPVDEVPMMQQLDELSTKVFATATSKQCVEIVELMEVKYSRRHKVLNKKLTD